MSVDWVTLDQNKHPIPLPSEEFIYQRLSDDRVPLAIKTVNMSTGGNINCATGRIYLSTQRLVYVGTSESSRYHVDGKGDKNFESISIPLTNISSARLHQPWIGPNAWVAGFTPVKNGGLEPELAVWEIKLTFGSGGAIDFAQVFERAMQARSVNQVHIDELPQYSA